MTNEELIAQLQKLDPKAPVYIDLNFLDVPIECNSVEYCDETHDVPGIFLDD